MKQVLLASRAAYGVQCGQAIMTPSSTVGSPRTTLTAACPRNTGLRNKSAAGPRLSLSSKHQRASSNFLAPVATLYAAPSSAGAVPPRWTTATRSVNKNNSNNDTDTDNNTETLKAFALSQESSSPTGQGITNSERAITALLYLFTSEFRRFTIDFLLVAATLRVVRLSQVTQACEKFTRRNRAKVMLSKEKRGRRQ